MENEEIYEDACDDVETCDDVDTNGNYTSLVVDGGSSIVNTFLTNFRKNFWGVGWNIPHFIIFIKPKGLNTTLYYI